jgi:hypothetical protein
MGAIAMTQFKYRPAGNRNASFADLNKPRERGPLRSHLDRLRLAAELLAEVESDSDGSLDGSWASVRGAAHLLDMAEGAILSGVLNKSVRHERRGGCLMVELGDVSRLEAKGAST